MDADIRPVLHELGFTEPRHVEGRTSIADLYKKRRCGIYVLHFADGAFYVGQAVDVVRRFAQHRHNHDDIQRISFKRVSCKSLNDEEAIAISHLETAGFRLRNKLGLAKFHQLMPPSEQERWLTDLDFQDLTGTRVVDDTLRSHYGKSYRRLLEMPFAEEVIQVMRQYVQNTIPAVKRGEIKFWSCVLGNSKSLYSQVNVGGQMTLKVSVRHNRPEFCWCLKKSLAGQILDRSIYRIILGFGRYFTTRPPSKVKVRVGKVSQIVGSEQQIYIYINKVSDALRFMNDDSVISVMRQSNLELVRKRVRRYSRSHCLDLADRLIE